MVANLTFRQKPEGSACLRERFPIETPSAESGLNRHLKNVSFHLGTTGRTRGVHFVHFVSQSGRQSAKFGQKKRKKLKKKASVTSPLQHGGESVIIWGFFCSREVSQLIFPPCKLKTGFAMRRAHGKICKAK